MASSRMTTRRRFARASAASLLAVLVSLVASGAAAAGERLVFDAFIGTELRSPFTTAVPADYAIPSGIAIDSRGFVYVADPKNNRVLLYDFVASSPTILTTLTNAGGGSVTLNFPIGVAVDLTNDDVWITNGKAFQLVKIDKNGKLLLTVGSKGSGPGQFEGAVFAAVDAGGNVYATDDGGFLAFGTQVSAAVRVQKFASNGTFLRSWGSSCFLGSPVDPDCNASAPGAKATGDGQFAQPVGIAVDSASNVYVVDDVNDRIQKFDSSGTFLRKWGFTGSNNGQFKSPRGIAVDFLDNVYVADAGNDRVQKFTSAGAFLSKEGSPVPTPPVAPGLGSFRAPSSIAAEPKIIVAVCLLLGLRCQKVLIGEATSDARVLQMDAVDDADDDGLLAEVDVQPGGVSFDFAVGPTVGKVAPGASNFVASAPTPQGATARPLSRPGVAADTVRITTGFGTTIEDLQVSWDCASAIITTVPDSTIQAHCSTPTLDVLAGQASLAFTGGDTTGATASLGAGDGVILLQSTSGIQATSGSPTVSIGGNSIVLVPGQTVFADTTPPTTTAARAPAPDANGLNNTDVTVTLNATDNPNGSGVKEIEFLLAGAQNGSATVSGSTVTIPVSAEGVTTLSYFARDNAGNQETTKTLTIHIDKTAPTVACVRVGEPPHGLGQGRLLYRVTASDGGSEIAGLTLGGIQLAPGEVVQLQPKTNGGVALDGNNDRGVPALKHIQVGPGVALVTATDTAGNVATAVCPLP